MNQTAGRTMRHCVLGLFLIALVVLIPAAAYAAAPVVKTVPYAYGAGNTVIPHPTYETGFTPGSPATCTTTKTVRLKGTTDSTFAANGYKYSWDFGDGSGATAYANVTNQYDLEASHAYCAVDQTIITAQLTVTNSSAQSTTTPYYIQVFDIGLASESGAALGIQASVAIDEGLWTLHNSLLRDSGGWTGMWDASGSPIGETAANTQAFLANGHTELSPDADPYTDDVQRTISSELIHALYSIPIAYGDSNGNGIALLANSGDFSYEHGMLLAMLVATNNKTGTAPGTAPANVAGRAYSDIAQDMVDGWAYCQYGSLQSSGGTPYTYGGWRYSCQSFPDNSTSQWAAISLISSVRQWGLTVPQWVYDSNKLWLDYSQANAVNGNCGYGNGEFGYTSTCAIWGPYATTSSGMVQMVMDSVGPTDPMFVLSESWQRDHWDYTGFIAGPIRTGYYYGLLSFVKSQELSIPPITTLHSATSPDPMTCGPTQNQPCANDFDWYADSVEGVAPALIKAQGYGGDIGRWYGHDYYSTQWNFDTAFAIEILNQTVIQTGKPVAVAKVQPPNGLIGQTMTLDGSGSYHQTPGKHIISWTWIINKVPGACGGACNPDMKTGQFVTDTFGALGQYQAQLTVGDDSTPQQTASTFVTINISVPPLPPIANAGGPYQFCNQVHPWVLNASKSTSPDIGQSEPGQPPNFLTAYNWDLLGNNTFTDATGVMPDAYPVLNGKAPASYLIQVRVTDNTALSFPSSGLGNLSSTASTTVTLQGDCACVTNLATYAIPNQVQLTWQNIGAASYNLYRSTDGVTYGLLASVPTPAGGQVVYQDSTVVNGTKYYYEVKPVSAQTSQEYCTSNVATATPPKGRGK